MCIKKRNEIQNSVIIKGKKGEATAAPPPPCGALRGRSSGRASPVDRQPAAEQRLSSGVCPCVCGVCVCVYPVSLSRQKKGGGGTHLHTVELAPQEERRTQEGASLDRLQHAPMDYEVNSWAFSMLACVCVSARRRLCYVRPVRVCGSRWCGAVAAARQGAPTPPPKRKGAWNHCDFVSVDFFIVIFLRDLLG